jgi:hypothetical protein
MQEKLYKATFEADRDLHGVRMREHLRFSLDERKREHDDVIGSEICNMEDNGRVEAVILASWKLTKDGIEALLKEYALLNPTLRPEDRDSIEITLNVIEDPAISSRIADSGKNRVITSSELKETVWALQGAGDLFLAASRDTRALLSIQNVSRKMQLEGLSFELQLLLDSLDAISKGKKPPDLVCLKSTLSRAYLDSPSLLEKLIRINYALEDLTSLPPEQKTDKIREISRWIKDASEITENHKEEEEQKKKSKSSF